MGTCTVCGEKMDKPNIIIGEGEVWMCGECLMEDHDWCHKCGRYGDENIKIVEFWKTGLDGHFCEDCIKILQKEHHCRAKPVNA